MNDLDRLLGQLTQSGKVPPELMQALKEAQGNPALLALLTEKLTHFAGPAAAQDQLNIEDYYQERDGSKFTLRFPLSPRNPLAARGIPFDALDRKTQFFTLFAEWSRREAEGMMSLGGGDLDDAKVAFDECLARADQIEVAELRARSYEGLARVAERRSDQKSVLDCLDKAEQARAEA